MTNILFTCAGRRTYLLKYFKEQLKGDGNIIGADMQATAPALSAADIKEIVPAVYDANYINTILDICKRDKVGILISLNDLELPILADNIPKFKAIGVKPIVSSKDVIDICFDKLKTAKFVEDLGLKAPKTFVSLDQAINAVKNGELKFPLILKPRWGSGSIGIEEVEDLEELTIVYNLLLKKVKRTILATASVGKEYIMIQQKITGKEFGLDIMNNLSGVFQAVSVKEKLAMRAGETDKATTVDNATLKEMGEKIGISLKHIGNLDCDILEMDGDYYVLEMNPRFGGGFPFSYEAGVNFPKAIIEWYQGKEVNKDILKPKVGLTFAKCDYLVPVG